MASRSLRSASTVLTLAAIGAASMLVAGAAGGATSRQTAVATPVTVKMGEYFYRPGRQTARVGQRVRFVNVGRIAHTVADTDAKGNIRSRDIKPRELVKGAVQVVVFKRPGTVRYVCTFHPTTMRGVITVLPRSG
jgi:plastocyanin